VNTLAVLASKAILLGGLLFKLDELDGSKDDACNSCCWNCNSLINGLLDPKVSLH